ncbi:MAG: tetratricopeptide repeat protein [candidate division WOR-3 bacterium]|jgi:tetratricopeptide (TPR) repeat protein
MTKKHKHPAPARSRQETYRVTTWRIVIRSKWLIPLCLVFLLGILLATREIADPDIGFHLRGGQWMLENMKFHSQDVFTYTVNGSEYIAMYWLYQIILYGIFNFAGYGGLTLFNILLIACVFMLILWRMRSAGIPVWATTLSLLAVILAIEFRFLYRPEVITWIMLLLTLFLLDEYHDQRGNHLFLLPVIQLIWVNSHGLFILGWVVTAAYFISTWVHYRSLDRPLLKWSLISVAASFINPYFLKGIAFPFYLFTRLQGSSIFKPMISEFQSPWTIKTMGADALFLTAPLHWYYLISAISLLFVIVTYRRRKLHEYLLLAAFLYLSATIVRNVPLFVFVAIQITAVSARDIAQRLTSKVKRNHLIQQVFSVMPVVFSIFVVLLGMRVTTNAFYLDDNRAVNFGAGLDRAAHPVGAADYINEHRLKGRILNDLNSGSWFIWQIPQPVFIDGRLEVIKENFFHEYIRSYADNGLATLLYKYQPRIIAFDHAAVLNWRRQLADHAGWYMVYLDDKSVIYGHESYIPPEQQIRLNELLTERGIDTIINDTTVWNILRKEFPSKFSHFLNGFVKRRNYADLLPMNLALFAYEIGEFRIAELLFLDILLNSVYYSYEAHFNLGAVYLRRGEYEKARYCYGRVLQLDRDNPYAKKYIKRIGRLIQENE